MTLPSTRRPAFLEEQLRKEAEEEEEKKKKEPLKLVLRRENLFMESMALWYQGLSEKNKRRLTKRKLQSRAQYVLYNLNYEYERLPKDWVQILRDKTGMILYKRKKKEVDSMDMDGEMMVTLLDPLLRQSIKASSKDAAVSLNVSLKEGKVKVEEKGKIMKWVNGKLVYDCTGLPPPQWYVDNYAKGILDKRELTTFEDEEKVVIFWDYEPKFKEMQTDKEKWTKNIHEQNDFKWDTMCKKYFEEEEDHSECCDDGKKYEYEED